MFIIIRDNVMTTRLLEPTRLLLGRYMNKEGDQSVEIVICLKSY